MRRTQLSVLIVASLFSQTVLAQTAIFRIHDHLDTAEIEETTSVYVDGVLARVVHLDHDHADEIVEVAAPVDGSPVTYALCGRITITRPDGVEEVHDVDGSGMLSDVVGRDYDAVAAFDFTVFYLKDISSDRPPAEILVRQARSCAEALS